MNLNCPYCQSTLSPQGGIDFNAPAIIVLNCPVCGFPVWIPQDYPVPRRWTSLLVINARSPSIPLSQFKAQNPTAYANLTQTPKEAAPDQGIYKDFSITKPIGDLAGNIASGTGSALGNAFSGFLSGLSKNIGGTIIIGGILVFVIILAKRK